MVKTYWLSLTRAGLIHPLDFRALALFMDYFPYDQQWEMFSLTNPAGRLVEAADEFEQLLQHRP